MMIILAQCGNGYCGCDTEDVFFFEDDTKEGYINGEIWQWACEHAESYAHVHFGWDEPYTDEDYDDYIENYVDFNWRDATYEEYVEWCENWGYEPKTKEEINNG